MEFCKDKRNYVGYVLCDSELYIIMIILSVVCHIYAVNV